jgi:hypothetical protein
MITQLLLERFKSIRQLTLKCRRINLFIGKPNTGKSNILEALGLLSWLGNSGQGDALKQYVRCEGLQNLFYDHLVDDPLRVECKGDPAFALQIAWKDNSFHLLCNGAAQGTIDFYAADTVPSMPALAPIKLYRYRNLESYSGRGPLGLRTPDGVNLISVIFSSKALREWLGELYRPYGLSAVLKVYEQTIELQKYQNGIVISYPLSTTSETLRRILFYHVAMQSNENAVLVFEEPEAHAFPYYTKHLGECIAVDASNQYFIATHNPYLLLAILEKAPQQDVAVYATNYVNYETTATLLTEDQMSRILEADPFLSLDAILERP